MKKKKKGELVTNIWMQGKLELLELPDAAFGSSFITCQNVTRTIILFVCKMCFTKINVYLTINSELWLNCLLSSGVQGGIRLLVLVELWPKIFLCEDGMKQLRVCPIPEIL